MRHSPFLHFLQKNSPSKKAVSPCKSSILGIIIALFDHESRVKTPQFGTRNFVVSKKVRILHSEKLMINSKNRLPIEKILLFEHYLN